MIRIFIIGILLCLFGADKQDSPQWGTLMLLDKAQFVVAGHMHVENLYEGQGMIIVSEVLKGKAPEKINVQFTDRHPNEKNTKHQESPKYWYNEGEDGIWILSGINNNKRFELRHEGLFCNKKWSSWIKEKLISLKNRKWSEDVNGIAASVILDDVGANQKYRFFYLCLKNVSDKVLFINTHYHSINPEQERYEAYIITPEGEKIDMIHGNNSDVRLYGMPGWPEPDVRDFKRLQPGETIYLPSYGDMRCFARNPLKGMYFFHALYKNSYIPKDFKGTVWAGSIEFPVVEFSYDANN